MMGKFKGIEAKMKNGKVVRIRQAETSDAENLLKAKRTYIPQSEYIPKLEQEIRHTVEQEGELINSFAERGNSLLLVAGFGDRIIGDIDLTGSQRQVMAHTAMIGMGMLQDWRNSGLGTALLSAALGWAKQNPVLELVWLQVYTENTLGLGLYKKMGFGEIGIMEGFFKKDGKYYDNLTMAIKVK